MRRWLGIGAVLIAACSQPMADGPELGSASVAASPSASAASAFGPATTALREAEQRRAAALVDTPDLTSRDPAVRRLAARALARIGGPGAREKLLALLADGDAEVVRWAAYGLGFDCSGEKEPTVSALAARAVSLPDDAGFDPAFSALARAVAACAAPRSEQTLVSWLGTGGARGRAAALALGDLAGRQKQLREESWVSLMARAEGGVAEPAMGEALFAAGRVDALRPSVLERVAAVAQKRLDDPGPFRLFAIRALGRTKDKGLGALERVLAPNAAFTLPERVEAARAAAKIGTDGQILVARLVDRLVAIGPALAEGSEDSQLLLAALAVLKEPKLAQKSLASLASLKPTSDGPRARRIASLLRCSAARAPDAARPADAALVACDLDKGWIGKRSLLEVLGRRELDKAGLKLLHDALKDPDPRVREAGLELLGGHSEVLDSAELLTVALGAKEAGVVTSAAEQIQKAPLLASPGRKRKPPADDAAKPEAAKDGKGKDGKDKDAKAGKKDDKPAEPADAALPPPSKELEKALVAALARAEKEQDLEMLATVIDAVGALGQKEQLPAIERFCQSSYPAAREHAKNAITLLGGKKPECPAPARAEELTPEALATPPAATVVLDSDAGELVIELDPTLAPATAQRFLDLVKRGYYDGNVLNRVDPSFVVQFGSPFGDSYSGPPDLAPLRCETSPQPFEELSVGLALSGRDTGSSQLFVMRARHPHLDGAYPIVGKAGGAWAKVMEGDVIRSAKIR